MRANYHTVDWKTNHPGDSADCPKCNPAPRYVTDAERAILGGMMKTDGFSSLTHSQSLRALETIGALLDALELEHEQGILIFRRHAVRVYECSCSTCGLLAQIRGKK